MIDERNFRSSYYEKVGFRSVEEKRSLEMLLRDKPFDKAKLKQFCLRFTVPVVYRRLLWKILLGVIPVYEESHNFVMAQRTAEFRDLKRALNSAKIIDNKTEPHQMFLMMWLLRTRRAKIDISSQLENELYRAMSKMAHSLWNMSDVEQEQEKQVEVYWIFSGFLDQVQRFSIEVSKLKECTCSMLEKEDKDLYNHMMNIGSIQSLPFDSWFHSCFAGTISDSSITKIWDKIAVGAYRILIFVSVIMLTTIKRCIMRCDSLDKVLEIINNITEETSEVIVNKAIEAWQQNGSIMINSQNPLPHVQNT